MRLREEDVKEKRKGEDKKRRWEWIKMRKKKMRKDQYKKENKEDVEYGKED